MDGIASARTMGGAAVFTPPQPAMGLQISLSSSKRKSFSPKSHLLSSQKSAGSQRRLGFWVLGENKRKNGFLVKDSAAETGANGSKVDGVGEEESPPPPRGIRWGELLLSPEPDNVVAVALTGVIAWAGLQLVWQLLLISFSILTAALKYSLVAALLLFILITLL